MWSWIDRIQEYTHFKKRYIVRAHKNNEYMTFILDIRSEKKARRYVMDRGFDVRYVECLPIDATICVQTEERDIIHFSRR